MANALVTSTVVTNEVLRIAHNASAFLGNMNTDYDDKWQGQYKPGQTVNARRPVQFTHRTGSTANIQDITESSVPVTVQPELGIDFAVSSNDLALAVGSNGNVSKEFKQRYLQPAGLKIAAILDYSIASIIKNGAHQMVGTPGTPPSSITDILNAQVPLDRMLIETDSPYLAPIPYRGKTNEPAWVSKVGEFIADLKGVPIEVLANQTSNNFYECFQIDRKYL